MSRQIKNRDQKNVMELLSPREFEIFILLARGYTGKYTAAKLGISEKTVAQHRSRVLEKLSICCSADITAIALLHRHIKDTRGFNADHLLAIDVPLQTLSETSG